MTDINTPDVL